MAMAVIGKGNSESIRCTERRDIFFSLPPLSAVSCAFAVLVPPFFTHVVYTPPDEFKRMSKILVVHRGCSHIRLFARPPRQVRARIFTPPPSHSETQIFSQLMSNNLEHQEQHGQSQTVVPVARRRFLIFQCPHIGDGSRRPDVHRRRGLNHRFLLPRPPQSTP